ncbi:MAG: methylenetetrahydrofolate reductase, partial [Thermobifida sp.]|nr:methylenetetrahydrofolate reductase [Thermobifida sp.]
VFGSRLIHSVLEVGAPGVHLYTFNRSKPVLDILALMGVKPDPLRSQASAPDTRA